MKKIPSCLEGYLLVAKPSLGDPNFRRSIVFMAHHQEDGALGFVVNRPLDKTVADVLKSSITIPEIFHKIPLLLGGPVTMEKLSIVVFQETPKTKAIRVKLGVPPDELENYVDQPSTWVRGFCGYSGWHGGQLEREIEEGAWEIRKPDRHIFDPRFIRGLWIFLIRNDNRWRLFVDAMPRSFSEN
ncbi:MAG: YqgE/AlgH family protein [Kiritimatiellae bacterium]|nr:YqgE/AlgH family protein [Kiritimatiellia bacterium]MDW8458656.1 YqgE/AlgH family protein [Verrucomicrobiota bacterium]